MVHKLQATFFSRAILVVVILTCQIREWGNSLSTHIRHRETHRSNNPHSFSSFDTNNNSSSNSAGTYLSSNGAEVATAGGNWIIEEVTSLPVTVTSAKYATFYAPVAVAMPEGITAHTVTLNGEWATLSEPLAVVPANTGVVLYADVDKTTTYGLDITSLPAKSAVLSLHGTIAKTVITKPENKECYVLSNGENGIGFYVAVIGDGDNKDTAKFYNAGHRAYLAVTKTDANVAKSYGLRFHDDTTVIEEITESKE